MTVGPFLDSNILVYAYSNDPRSGVAKAICAQPHIISVQSLNEFANVSRRKLHIGWDDIVLRLVTIVDLAETVIPLTFELHQNAIALADRYKLQLYDCLIIAAAIGAGCDTLYSEDMQHGLLIEDYLIVRNPFI